MSFHISSILLDLAVVRQSLDIGPGRSAGRSGGAAAAPSAGTKRGAARSWPAAAAGRGSSGAELAGGGRGSGELQGLRVPGPPPPRRSFV